MLNYLNNKDTNFGVYVAHRINELDNRQTQTIAATSKQSKTQLIIPHVIRISYPYQKMSLGYLDRHFLRKNHDLKWNIITSLYRHSNPTRKTKTLIRS